MVGKPWLPSKGPNSPFSAGGRPVLARTCLSCGVLADGDSFAILNRGTKNEARRRVCHLCTNARKKRDREERGIGLPGPRPPERLQTSKYQRWSAEDDELLTEAIRKGWGYEEIAVALGRSLNSVYTRRGILGLARVRSMRRVEKPWIVRKEQETQ
jgi:hypothetical protein